MAATIPNNNRNDRPNQTKDNCKVPHIRQEEWQKLGRSRKSSGSEAQDQCQSHVFPSLTVSTRVSHYRSAPASHLERETAFLKLSKCQKELII